MRFVLLFAACSVIFLVVSYIWICRKEKKETKSFLSKKRKLSEMIRCCPSFPNPEDFLRMFNDIDTNTLNFQYFPKAIGRYDFIDEYKFTFKEMGNLKDRSIPCLVYENIKGDEIIIIPNSDSKANPLVLFDIVPRTKFKDLDGIGFNEKTLTNPKTYSFKTRNIFEISDSCSYQSEVQEYKTGAAGIIAEENELQKRGFTGSGIFVVYFTPKEATNCIAQAAQNTLGTYLENLYKRERFDGVVATYSIFNPKDYCIND